MAYVALRNLGKGAPIGSVLVGDQLSNFHALSRLGWVALVDDDLVPAFQDRIRDLGLRPHQIPHVLAELAAKRTSPMPKKEAAAVEPEPEVAPAGESEPDLYTKSQLLAFQKAELVKRATALGIDMDGSVKKADLVDAILAHQEGA